MAARHLNDHVEIEWSSDKLELADMKMSEKKFFVRVKGTEADKLASVEAAFGKVSVVKLDELTDEFAFVTEVMSEQKFEDASAQVEGIITRIRME